MELNKEEYIWTKKPVIGMALLIIGGSIDSFGNEVNSDIYYEVGKHKETGKVALLPTEMNQKHEFINDTWKKQGKFN